MDANVERYVLHRSASFKVCLHRTSISSKVENDVKVRLKKLSIVSSTFVKMKGTFVLTDDDVILFVFPISSKGVEGTSIGVSPLDEQDESAGESIFDNGGADNAPRGERQSTRE